MDAYRYLCHELQAIRARTSGTAEIRVLAITTLGEDYRFSDSIGGAGELGQASLARGPFLELFARGGLTDATSQLA